MPDEPVQPYNDPTGWAAKASAFVGALVAAVALVVGAIQEGGMPDAASLTQAIVALVVAGGGVWADLRARRHAIAPATLVDATNGIPRAKLPPKVAALRDEALGVTPANPGAGMPGVPS